MTELLALQTTPALPESTGGGTSPLAILTVVAAIGYVVQTRTAIDLLGLVSSFGGSGGDTSSSAGAGGGGGLLGFVTSINGLAIGALTLLSALIIGGAVDVPAGTGIAFVVGLELTALLLILGEFEAIRDNVGLIVLVGLGTVVIGLSAAGEPVIGALASSPAFPILVVGLLALGWRAISAYRASKRTVIRVRGRTGEDDGS